MLFGHLVQTQPPKRRARNWMAPPGICRYWVPRVSKPKEETIIEVKDVRALLGTWAPTAMMKRIHVFGSWMVWMAW